jgi:sugar (pentulose or hexulose) kinase
MDALLGIDIGTTHCKAGVFTQDGRSLSVALAPTLTRYDPTGSAYYEPEEIWLTIKKVMTEAIEKAGAMVAVIGISSMAETGVLINRLTGEAVSEMIPWFDRRASKEAEEIASCRDPFEHFVRTGLHPSFKYGLPKLLWLRKRNPQCLTGSVWLSAADYIAYRLSGVFATDYTLAARTYAFRMDRKSWDTEVMDHLGLDVSLFPKAVPSGTPIGYVQTCEWNSLGVRQGTPVAISGHDHVCTMLGAGAVAPGAVLNSIGTAETLVGIIQEHPVGMKEYKLGMTFGCHAVANRLFWMGGLPASGGSVEWLRALLGEQPLDYNQIESLLEGSVEGPTGIYYFPYLSGSGAPLPSSAMKGALLGLTMQHGRADVVKAMFEGICYQMEAIKRAGEAVSGEAITTLNVVGGGSKNGAWMQLKADISNASIRILQNQEAALIGAALIAALGSGMYADAEEAASVFKNEVRQELIPDPIRHQSYEQLFRNEYEPMMRMMGNR